MFKKYRLTWPQKSILLTEQYYNISQVNNVGTKLGVNKGFIPELLKKAIYLTYNRYDVFKIRILEENGEFYQVFDDKVLENIDIPIVYLETEKELKAYLQEVIDKPFDISKYMIRASVFMCKNGKKGYVGAYHHIVNDGFSQYLVSDTIFRFYEFLLKIYTNILYTNGLIRKFSNAGLNRENQTKEEYESNIKRALKAVDVYIQYLKSINSDKYMNLNLNNLKVDSKKECIEKIISIDDKILLDIFEIYYDKKVEKTLLENLGKKIEISDIISVPKYVNQLEKEEEYKESERFKKDEEYWKNQISKQPKIVSLSKKKKEQNTAELLKASRLQFSLNNRYLNKLHKYCKEQNISPFNFFMAIYAIYTSHMTMENKFALGTPVLNRANREERKIPGMFVSTLPYIADINGEQKIVEYLKDVKVGLSKILRHQKYPYNMILKESNKVQNTNSNIYNILLSYQITKRENSDIYVDNYDAEWIHSTYNADELDIHIYDIDGGDNFEIAYDYQLAKFTKADIIALHNRVIEMSENILDKKYEKIDEVEVTTKSEREDILKKYNKYSYINKGWGIKENHKIKNLRINRAENLMIDFLKNYNSYRLRNKLCIVDNVINGTQKYTYLQIMDTVLKRAEELTSKGIKAKDKVVIIADANIYTVINILAVLVIGATYIPIDENYPKERIIYILEDSNAKAIITKLEKVQELELKNINSSKIILEIDDFKIQNSKDINIRSKRRQVSKLIKNLERLGDSLAYIIYTSGSTSNPKGVTISNQSLYKYITWAKEEYVKNEKTNFPLYSSISFDLTVTSIFTPIYSKNTMYIYDKKDILNTLKSMMQNRDLDILKLTPAHLKLVNMFEPELLKNTTIKKMILGGDILSNVLCNSICSKIQGLKIFNEYGPTETTVGIMKHIYSKKDEKYDSVPIGVPAKESMIYIVNQYGRILPLETFGEMVIETKSIFDGYVNLEEKTKATRKKSKYTNNMMYLTGDIALIHNNLIMEYIGRKDFQVKINGYRIELGEISAQLLKFKDILECYVMVHEEKSTNKKQIVVYYTVTEAVHKQYNKKKITEQEIENNIKQHLQKYLMPYMIPEKYILLEKMPLTINGKIDKKCLPNPNTIEISKKIILPQTELEKIVAEELKKISKQTEISIDENILKYGIDSLDIINMQMQLVKKGINIPTQKIYNLQTIQNICKYIEENNYDDHIDTNLEKYTDISYAKKNINKEYLKQLENLEKNNKIIIFGSTGFLGMHILKEFLVNTKYDINVIIREKEGLNSKDRLNQKLKYYFSEELTKEYLDRIEVFNGDILKENFGLNKREYNRLAKGVRQIISTAAIVKHFGDEELFIKTNIEGTNKMIAFAKEFKIPLNYVSTLTVSGYGMVQTKDAIFTENTLYVGQKYMDNIYVRTKFESEKNIIDAVEKGDIIASIYRVGNITNRETDCKFQENMSENAFTNRIKSLLELKETPKEIVGDNIEFAPVDKLANIIMNLVMLKKQKTLNIYHVQNTKYITLEKVIGILKEASIDIKYTPIEEYVQKISKNPEKYYGIINYITMYSNMDRNNIVKIDSKQTQYILKENDIEFNEVSKEYILGVVKYIQQHMKSINA